MSLDKKPQRPVIQRLDRGLVATTVFVSVPFLFVLCSASVGTFFYFLLLASSLHALEGTATGRLGPYPYGLLSERQWFPLNGKVMGKNSDWPDLTDIRTLGVQVGEALWLAQPESWLKYAQEGGGRECHDQSAYQDHIKEEKDPPKERKFCSYRKENGEDEWAGIKATRLL